MSEDRPQVVDARFTSFITQVFTLPPLEVTVLLNKSYPWLRFCRPLEPGQCMMEFVDVHRLADAFTALGRYRVLTMAELDQPVRPPMCAELAYSEMKQITYWSKLYVPRNLRVGDVVFNFWD